MGRAHGLNLLRRQSGGCGGRTLSLPGAEAPVREGEVDPVSVQHIVRSFDSCLVCTVH